MDAHGRACRTLCGAAAIALSLAVAVPASALLISLSNTASLGFGEAFIGSTLGTVVVTPAGARSATGGVTLGSSGSAGGASFTVTGVPLLTYSITLPSSATLAAGGSTITVNSFTSSPSGSGSLPLGGSQVLRVGATLRVGANQTPGSYSGTFSVTVAYN